jgi:predicted ATP-grasp superfamily ATP-dependent carboligase
LSPPVAYAPGSPNTATVFAGKAIIMAARDLVFPAAGPWDEVIESPKQVTEMPPFADIPKPGETIKAGRPVLTLLVRSSSLAACRQELRERALDLDRQLVGP